MANKHMNLFIPELGTFRRRLRRRCGTTSRISCPIARKQNKGNSSIYDCQICPFVSIILEKGVWCQLTLTGMSEIETLFEIERELK